MEQQPNRRAAALTESERRIHEQEKQKLNEAIHVIEVRLEERKRAAENILRLLEERNREKEEALGQVLKLEKKLAVKHNLEMAAEEVTRNLEVLRDLEAFQESFDG